MTRALSVALLVVAAGCATTGTDTTDPASNKRAAITGLSRIVGFWFTVEPDCTSPGRPKVRIVTPPRHGVLSVTEGEGFPSYPQDNARFGCNSQRVPGIYVRYKSNAEFTGVDSPVVELLFSNGATRQSAYTIEVVKPVKISGASPVYPQAARRKLLEGEVIAWLHVSAGGEVTNVEIKTSADGLFSEEVRSTLRDWKFRLPTRDAESFAYVAEFRIIFSLANGSPAVDQGRNPVRFP